MIDRASTEVVRIPIDQITVVNPRTRGKHKFRQIVSNISNIGLKRPITVVERGVRDGKPFYELVCGQGRLEACRSLGEVSVPALVVKASREDLMLMSLAENLARRRQSCAELLKEVGVLKERGYTFAQIAEKTDLHHSYVKGIARLLKHGEARLLTAVERGQIPISIAVVIATSSDDEVQRALADAYQNNDLRGKQLIRARRIIEARRNTGKSFRAAKKQIDPEVTGDALVQAYRRETTKQRLLVQKAKVCETRLLFVASALRQLLADDALVSILKAGGLGTLPQYLAEQVATKEVVR